MFNQKRSKDENRGECRRLICLYFYREVLFSRLRLSLRRSIFGKKGQRIKGVESAVDDLCDRDIDTLVFQFQPLVRWLYICKKRSKDDSRGEHRRGGVS